MAGISRQKLLSWGLLKQVTKEEIIDKNIMNVSLSDDIKMELIIEEWLKNNGVKSNDLLKIWLKEKGLDIEQWKKFVIRDHKWRKWCRKNFDKELSSYYLKRKPLLDRFTYSLVRVKDEDFAFELYMRILEKEEDFNTVATKYSEGPESKYGGEIGPVTLKQTHPLLAKLLLISEQNQLWPPRKIDNWWVIIKLVKLETTKLDDEMKSLLSYELGEEFLRKNSEVPQKTKDLEVNKNLNH